MRLVKIQFPKQYNAEHLRRYSDAVDSALARLASRLNVIEGNASQYSFVSTNDAWTSDPALRDTELLAALTADRVYLVDIFVWLINIHINADFQFKLVTPNPGSNPGRLDLRFVDDASNLILEDNETVDTAFTIDVTASSTNVITGRITGVVTTDTSGDLVLQGAQAAGNANVSTLSKGSWMRVIELGQP